MGFGWTAPSVAKLTPKVKVDMASTAQSALPYRHNSREQRYIPGPTLFLAQSRSSARRRGQRELALATVRAAKQGHRIAVYSSEAHTPREFVSKAVRPFGYPAYTRPSRPLHKHMYRRAPTFNRCGMPTRFHTSRSEIAV